MTDASIQDVPKKKQQILATAEELFFRHGIKRVTVEEICRKAKVSKMTFYKYFPDKIALAHHIWRAVIEEAITKIDEFDALNIPFQEKLKRIFEYTDQLTTRMENDFVKDFIALDLDHLDQDRALQRMTKLFTDAQQRGEVRPDIKPEFLLAIHDKTHELMHDEQLLKLYPDYTAYNRECFNFFCYGILTPPPSECRSS